MSGILIVSFWLAFYWDNIFGPNLFQITFLIGNGILSISSKFTKVTDDAEFFPLDCLVKGLVVFYF